MDFQFTDNSGEVLKALEDAVARSLKECGLLAEGYAKEELSKPKTHSSPRVNAKGSEVYDYPNVDTGVLRNSITHDTDDTTAYVGTNVEYAPYVEMGTSKSKPYPYLQPAVQNHKEEYKAIIERELKG